MLTPHVDDPPERATPEAVVHLMRLANANPIDSGVALRSSTIFLARQLNTALPESERIMLIRDPRTREPFVNASNEELVKATYIAVGAYIGSQSHVQNRRSRIGGYLMLEQYFAYSAAMWAEAVRHGALSDPANLIPSPTLVIDAEAYRAAGFIAHWLASLCPVIEGWEELKLSDSAIDMLLEHGVATDARTKLFRFRHGVFHFQRRSDDPRFADFMDENGAARLWAIHLEREFERFFRYHASRNYEELSEWIER